MLSNDSAFNRSINAKLNALEDRRLRALEETKKCFNCGRWGHVVRTCRAPMKQKYPITYNNYVPPGSGKW